MSAAEIKSQVPNQSTEFDRFYKSSLLHWVWSDIRIPVELKELVERYQPKTSLEFGCGLGRFSAYMVEQGIIATGVDFSQVAIEKAVKRLAGKDRKPVFLVGDVTNLEMLHEPYDVAFDVGCFHCLNASGQQKYAVEAYRLLFPGSILLIWALDRSPSDIELGPDYMAKTFSKGFRMLNSKPSRRRVIASHWYWFVRKDD
jgi:SAM-dependent methyltransferase